MFLAVLSGGIGVEIITGFVSCKVALCWVASKEGGSIFVEVFSSGCIGIALADVEAGKDSTEPIDCAFVITIGGTKKKEKKR